MIYTQGNCFTIFSLKVLTYTLILGNIKTNGLITTTKNPLVYYEIFFIPIKFEVTILSTLTSNIIKYLLGFFCLTKSQHYFTIKKTFAVAF